MNSWLKLLLILGVTFLVVKAMQVGWGGPAGAPLPATVKSLVLEAKALDRKAVILITGSGWCPPCMQLEREVLSSGEWAAFVEKEVVFKVFDYPNGGQSTSPAHKDLLELPGFRGFPTMIVADRDGKVLGMRTGFAGGGSDYIGWIQSL